MFWMRESAKDRVCRALTDSETYKRLGTGLNLEKMTEGRPGNLSKAGAKPATDSRCKYIRSLGPTLSLDDAIKSAADSLRTKSIQ